jgi:hypothetical protein
MVTEQMPYKDLNYTLKCIKIQIIDSIPFAAKMCPDFKSPEKIFNWLKGWTRYENDPKGVELLQTMQTLWAQGGKGDCDCFVITTIACLLVCGFNNIKVALVGRTPTNAVHIYTVCTWNGKQYIMDLTNTYINQERYYPYKQLLNFKLN